MSMSYHPSPKDESFALASLSMGEPLAGVELPLQYILVLVPLQSMASFWSESIVPHWPRHESRLFVQKRVSKPAREFEPLQ